MFTTSNVPTNDDATSWIPAHLKEDEPIPGWLRLTTTAKLLRVSTATLNRWDRQRIGPVRTKVGKAVFYREESIRAWLLAQEKAELKRAA